MAVERMKNLVDGIVLLDVTRGIEMMRPFASVLGLVLELSAHRRISRDPMS
jgi:hypothetical protein